MRQWWIFIALAIVILAGRPVAGQAVADQLIVPGERVSAVALGMPMSQGIAAALETFRGSPIAASGGSVPTTFRPCQPARADEVCIVRGWRTPDGGVVLLTFVGSTQDSAQLAMILLIGAPMYRTAEGIANRVPLTDITRAYGPPTYVGPRLPYAPGRVIELPDRIWQWWADKGLAVTGGGGDTVLTLVVLRPQ